MTWVGSDGLNCFQNFKNGHLISMILQTGGSQCKTGFFGLHDSA
jgi:hypothetical protein